MSDSNQGLHLPSMEFQKSKASLTQIQTTTFQARSGSEPEKQYMLRDLIAIYHHVCTSAR